MDGFIGGIINETEEYTKLFSITVTVVPAPGTHVHSFGTAWEKDATNHWHECACGEKSGLAVHTPGGWIVDTPATGTTPGSRHKQCTICGYVTATEIIPATGGGSNSTAKGILGTNPKYNKWYHYILFFLCFGFIWMWF